MKISLQNAKAMTLTALLTVGGFALAQTAAKAPAQAPAAAATATEAASQPRMQDDMRDFPRRGFRGPVSLEDHRAMAEKRFARMDANGDGSISKDEFMALSDERFKAMDTNGDGVVTPDERRAMRKHFKHGGGKQWRQDGNRPWGKKHGRHHGCWQKPGYDRGMMPPAMGGWQAPAMPGYGPGNGPWYMPGYVPGYAPAYVPALQQAPAGR